MDFTPESTPDAVKIKPEGVMHRIDWQQRFLVNCAPPAIKFNITARIGLGQNGTLLSIQEIILQEALESTSTTVPVEEHEFFRSTINVLLTECFNESRTE